MRSHRHRSPFPMIFFGFVLFLILTSWGGPFFFFLLFGFFFFKARGRMCGMGSHHRDYDAYDEKRKNDDIYGEKRKNDEVFYV